jgi:gliding motility-associated-like protein
VINQTSIENNDFNVSYDFSAACFLKDSSALIGGAITINDPAVISRLAFLKADVNQHFSCDTTVSVSLNIVPVVQNTISTNSISRMYTSTNQFLTSETYEDSTYFICSTFPSLLLNLGADTSLCVGNTLTLKSNIPSEIDNFLWSTGESTPAISVSQSGKYWLRGINTCRNEMVSDTIIVEFKAFPKVYGLFDTAICSNEALILDASILNGKYLWQDGSTSPTFKVTEPGEYAVQISYLNCTQTFLSLVGDCEILLLPNVITPNGDELNNLFVPIEMRGIRDTKIKIFNRWGQEIFSSSDLINNPWDGKYKLRNCPQGVYFWIVEYTNYRLKKKIQKGSVSLFAD